MDEAETERVEGNPWAWLGAGAFARGSGLFCLYVESVAEIISAQPLT